ncbi:MAG: hypothetical protein SF187_18125 [Deltaproteobacteria bacterium]|nr:hypothetical protein [Deltaproteobacteria bacterium]
MMVALTPWKPNIKNRVSEDMEEALKRFLIQPTVVKKAITLPSGGSADERSETIRAACR